MVQTTDQLTSFFGPLVFPLARGRLETSQKPRKPLPCLVNGTVDAVQTVLYISPHGSKNLDPWNRLVNIKISAIFWYSIVMISYGCSSLLLIHKKP